MWHCKNKDILCKNKNKTKQNLRFPVFLDQMKDLVTLIPHFHMVTRGCGLVAAVLFSRDACFPVSHKLHRNPHPAPLLASVSGLDGNLCIKYSSTVLIKMCYLAQQQQQQQHLETR